MQKTVSPKAQPQPPLEVEERTETHPKTGGKVRITRSRRGILVTETKHHTDTLAAFEELAAQSPRKNLEMLCDHLRDELASRELPSDRQPHWMKINDGEWQESRTTPLPLPEGRVSFALWTLRLEELTETLSPERAAGDLLLMLTQLLDRPGIDKHLWHIERFAHRLASYRITKINHLAHLGLTGRRARAAGPKARKAKSIKINEVILACAQEYWVAHPAVRNVANPTALAITLEVNKRLMDRGLLPKGRNALSAKTIADYIRKEFRAQEFQNREIGCGNRQVGIVAFLAF